MHGAHGSLVWELHCIAAMQKWRLTAGTLFLIMIGDATGAAGATEEHNHCNYCLRSWINLLPLACGSLIARIVATIA
jgi:hypothetical protein